MRVSNLEIGDYTTVPLTGSDTLGVMLRYPRWRIYCVTSMANSTVVGTNVTCAQVVVGVYTALITLMTESLQRCICFPGNLYDTIDRCLLFSRMRVEHFICDQRRGWWVVSERDPELRPRPRSVREQSVI